MKARLKRIPKLVWCIIIVVAITVIIITTILLNKKSKETEDPYGYYTNDSVIIHLDKNDKCSVEPLDGDDPGVKCSWKMGDNVNKSGENFPTATIKVSDGEHSMNMDIVFQKEYSGFVMNGEALYTRIYNYTDDWKAKHKNKTSLKTNKSYEVVSAGGSTGYITFNSDGTCTTDFSSFNKCGWLSGMSGSEKMCINYSDKASCTYTKDSNGIITVNSLSDFKLIYYFKLGNGVTSNATIERGYTMENIKFQYDKENDLIETINGEWKAKQSETFAYVYFISDDKKTNTDEKDSSGSTNDDSEENPSSYSALGDAFEDAKISGSNSGSSGESVKRNLINDVYVIISKTGYNKDVSIRLGYVSNDEIPNFIKSFKINGTPYAVSDWAKLNLYKNGENCYTIQIEDYNNQTRNIKKCYNFDPDSPQFNVVVRNCEIQIWNNSSGDYNELRNLKWYLDGNLLSNNAIILGSSYMGISSSVSAGKHTLKGVNEFGVSSEKSFTLSTQCS